MAPLRTPAQALLMQARTLRPATLRTPTRSLLLSRRYHPTGALSSTGKNNLQDRESLNPRRSEGTNTGTDDQVAEKSDAAFNPNKTKPEDAKQSAAQHSNGNPLEASGANQEFSRSANPEETTADKTDKKTRSKGSSGTKHGKVGA